MQTPTNLAKPCTYIGLIYSDLTGGYFKSSCWGLTWASGTQTWRLGQSQVGSAATPALFGPPDSPGQGPQATSGRALSPFISE